MSGVPPFGSDGSRPGPGPGLSTESRARRGATSEKNTFYASQNTAFPIPKITSPGPSTLPERPLRFPRKHKGGDAGRDASDHLTPPGPPTSGLGLPMPTSYGALCSGFTASQKLLVSMNLPAEREPVLGLFERVRKQRPALRRFRRYSNELALESGPLQGKIDDADVDSEEWVALRKRSVRSGVVNPSSMMGAKDLHSLVLQTSPFYLGINPLEVEYLEVSFAFDMDASGNHNRIVAEALLGNGPLAKFVEKEMEERGAQPIDVQPFLGLAFGKAQDIEAYLELKTKTGPTPSEGDESDDLDPSFGADANGLTGGRGRGRGFDFDASDEDEDPLDAEEPITVYLTVRRNGPLTSVDELPAWLDDLWSRAERLTDERVAPLILKPLRRAIASGRV